jgi:hypothetical protein
MSNTSPNKSIIQTHKVLSTLSNREVRVAQSKQPSISYKLYGPGLLRSSSVMISLDLLLKSLSHRVDSGWMISGSGEETLFRWQPS